MNILFITWDGPQTNYLESLFLPIFSGLSSFGYNVHVLQFTWANSDRISETKSICQKNGIQYRSAPIIRKFGGLGPLLSSLMGGRHIDRAVKDWKIDALMPRSLMPGLSVLVSKQSKLLHLIFDADGFVADERVDFGNLSRKSLVYRLLRKVEAQVTQNADTVLVRTPKAIEILRERSGCSAEKFFVVTNGRDPAPYLEIDQSRREREFTLCYAGSLGDKYCVDTMIDLAISLRKHLPKLVFKVYTGDKNILTKALDRAGIKCRSWIAVARLQADQMPKALMECDLGIVFIQSAFSTQGVVPIKLGEYMLAGLPVVGYIGSGAADKLVEEQVFLSVKDDLGIVWPYVRDTVIPRRDELRARAKSLGCDHFSLQSSVLSYAEALKYERR